MLVWGSLVLEGTELGSLAFLLTANVEHLACAVDYLLLVDDPLTTRIVREAFRLQFVTCLCTSKGRKCLRKWIYAEG